MPFPLPSGLASQFREANFTELPSASTKTDAEKALIKRAIEENSMFTCLDEQQISTFIECCRPVTFEAGEHITLQDTPGDNFYIVADGIAEIFDEMQGRRVRKIRSKAVGESFGEGAFFYERQRSATVVAKTQVKCWIVNRQIFTNTILDSSQQRKIFNKHATATDVTGEKVMTMSDFVKACGSSDPLICAQIQRLFRLFRGESDVIPFKEFTMFNVLMTRPDPEYDIAFLMLDVKRKGYITIKDIKEYIKHQSRQEDSFRFDFDCDLIKRFFGRDGKGRLRIDEFSLFFSKLQLEIGQQAFRFMDESLGGQEHLSREDFVKVLTLYGGWEVPPGVLESIQNKSNAPPRATHRQFAFSDFLAYQYLLSHLPALCTAILTACETKGGPVSKDDFKVASRALLGSQFSRVEHDAVFEVFDTDRDGFISPQDVKNVAGERIGRQIRLFIGREGKMTFAPPPGYSVDARSNPNPTTLAKTRSNTERANMSPLMYLRDFAEHFLMGAIAGGIGAAAVYPIDLIKTRIQNQRRGKVTLLKDGAQLPQYKNAWDCFLQTVRKEGPLGLYRGLLPQLVGVAPEKAIKLTVNDFLRDAFTNRDKMGKDSIYFPLEVLAGCGAGASQVVFTNPLEIVKIRLQVQGETQAMFIAAGKTPPPAQSAVAIVKELGLLGLYKGSGACFLRDIPFSGIYFPAYAAAKKWLQKDTDELQPHHLLLAGALAGVPAASLTTPADVIKTRLQVVAREGEATYLNIGDCAIKIFQQEGMSAFFKGAEMRVLRSSPQFGVTLLAYELLHRLVSPNSQPRPPTNVPIDQEDYQHAFYSEHLMSSVGVFMKMVTNLGNMK